MTRARALVLNATVNGCWFAFSSCGGWRRWADAVCCLCGSGWEVWYSASSLVALVSTYVYAAYALNTAGRAQPANDEPAHTNWELDL